MQRRIKAVLAQFKRPHTFHGATGTLQTAVLNGELVKPRRQPLKPLGKYHDLLLPGQCQRR
jgi:hypothetical protein